MGLFCRGAHAICKFEEYTYIFAGFPADIHCFFCGSFLKNRATIGVVTIVQCMEARGSIS